jgi:hypothetical protein
MIIEFSESNSNPFTVISLLYSLVYRKCPGYNRNNVVFMETLKVVNVHYRRHRRSEYWQILLSVYVVIWINFSSGVNL